MLGIGFGFRYLNPFFDDEAGGGAGDVQELPAVPGPSDDDIDELSGDDDKDDDAEVIDDDKDDDDKDDDTDDKDDKDDKDDVDDDKDDVIDEDKDKKDDKDDDKKDDKDDKTDDKRVPSIKALKDAYPDIFKKFPHVRVAIAEHQQFRAVYSSVDEAREAAESQDNFHQMSDKLLEDNDFGYLLDELNKADSAATARLVKKVLPAILERSKDLYMDITEVPISQFVHAAYRRAKADGNKNLENSALHIWKFLGKDGTPSPVEAGPDPKEQEFQNRVKEFEGRKFQEATQSVNGQISEQLETLIESSIDPKGTLKPTTKRALTKELIRLVDSDVAGDRNHMSRIERLWTNARRSSYAQGHLSRIISAYLERAKQVLPKHARQIREENNISDEPKGDKGERRPQAQREHKPPVRPSTGSFARPKTIRDTNPRDIDWSKTSDEDVLSGKAVLRRR